MSLERKALWTVLASTVRLGMLLDVVINVACSLVS